MAPPRISGIIIDVSDGPRAAAFWAGVFEVDVAFEFDEFVFFDVSDIHLVLQIVPDPKVVKNRVHFDLTSDDPAGFIDKVVDLGGSIVSTVDKPTYALTVLADPDGNEFCVSRQPSTGLT
ncbi:MAG: VOC family protein [Acidimicrobiia bacterium]|nr:VOC family protein [Acidimicrobiia bacterium]MDH5503404.1 VOC family protein [Acidimicrobiia bacterium]